MAIRAPLRSTAGIVAPAIQRVTSGVPGLDPLMEGGFVKNSINLIAGQTGTGKTILCMHYIIEGLRKGESCVYMSLEQKPEEIIMEMAKFGQGDELNKYLQSGKLIIAYHTPTDIKELEQNSFQNIKKIGASRFVLDSLSIATMGWKTSSMDIGKIRSDIFSYMLMLKNAGTTSLLITEVPEAEEKKLSRFGIEEFLVDGIVKLNYIGIGGEDFTNLEIRKMRVTKHARGLYPMIFTDTGIKVGSESRLEIR